VRTLRALLLRVRALGETSAADRDVAEELESHLQMHIEDNVRGGMSPGEARRQALARFGSVEAVKERCRERRRLPGIDMLVADIRYGFRMMRRSPGFTLVATLSLAVGIGATAAIFSVINALVLRALPVPRPHEVRVVRNTTHLASASRFSYPMFGRFTAGMPAHARIAAMSRVARMRTRVGGTGEPANALVQLVSGEFFPVLEVSPAVGRLLGPGDEAHAVAVVSHAFWQGRLGGSADVVGTSLTLNGAPVTIIGVARDGFSGVWLETPVDAWVPVAMQAPLRYIGNFSATDADVDKPWMDQDGIRWLELILRAGRVDGAEAAAIDSVFRQSQAQAAEHVGDPEERAALLRQRVVLEDFGRGFSNVRERFAAPLFALMAMVSLLLLIACANTANLLLARAAARQREIAVRLSLGASRGRVMQQLLTESVLLAALAGVAGMALAPWASEALVRLSLGVTTGPLPLSVPVDGRVLVFATVVSILTGLLFGLAPAWRTTRITLTAALKGIGTRAVMTAPG
jgi:predicted permease